MTLTPEQLKAIQEKADAMRKAAQPPAAEAAPPAPKPAPRRPPPKPRPEPTQDVSGLERRIAQIDEELGQGPQQTAGGIRLAKIRDAAYEVVRVSKLPAKSPQDIEASNKALQEYVRLETEERDDAADAYQRSLSPEVKLRTQAERVRRDLTPEGQTSIGDLKRIDDKLVPIEDKITKLGQSSGMGDVKKWDEPIFQAREDYESKPVDKSYSPVLMDPSGMPVEQYVPQEEKDARDESQKHLRNLSLRSDPSYFDVPDPELGGLIEAPIDLVEDQSLRENIEKLRNEFYASPFVKEGGTADIYHIRVDPFRLVGSDSDPSPAVLLDRLTDAYTLGEYRVRGYTSDNRPTQKEYDQIRERARDLAQNKLLSVWAEYGNANFRVMKDADKAIDDALAWGPAMAPLMLLGTAGTGLAGFEHDATGRKVLSGIPIYQRGDSLTNSFRISPITAVWAWLDDPNGSVDIGGENGWGSKSQLKREVYGYEPSQSLEHLLLANRIFTGAATITEAEGHSSPLIKLAIQNYGVDDNSNMGREAAAYAGTAFTGLAYLLLDPNVWNVATLGAAKLSKPLGMTRALNTLRLRYATEAETLEQLAIKIATMEGDDAAKAKAILELEAATHQKPGSPQALIVESARSRVRVRNANRVAGAVDPETHLPRASAAANERRYVGDFVPMEPGITPEQQELLGAQGQKFQAAEQSAKLRMAARQAKAARAAKDFELEFGRPPGQAQSAEQVAEARLFARARRALEGNEAGLQAIGEVESAQAARDAAAVKLAPIELTFRGKRQAGSIQQILRALYTNHRAVMRLATGYLSDLAGASEAGRKIATNRYLAEISKLAQNQIANLGDLSVATSIAEFAKLDAALDAKIQTVVHQLGLSPLDGPAVAREFGQLRAAHARSLDAIGRYEDLFKAARALDPTTVAEMYAKEFGDLKDSLRAGVKKIPEPGNVELEYPKHVQDGKIDGPAYHQALMEKYGVAYERSMDSPLVEPMKRLSRQKGIALTSFQEDALRDMEQGLAAEAFKRGPYAGVAYGQGLIQTLLDSPRFRGDLTLLWARLLNRWGRRLDLVGGTEMGMRSATAKIVVRHNYERVRATLRDVYAITSGEIQPLGELSGPPLHGVEAALDFLTNPKRPLFYDYMGQPLPWNQGGMTPAEKAYHYIRSVVAVDGAARNLTVKILQGMPLASGQAAREPVVGRALGVITRKFSASPPKDMATFYDEVLDGLESVFYKEKGATDARGVSRHFLVNALSYGSAQYDGWLEIQRLMGTGMDATTANALNYMQVSDASALAIGSPELAAATAGRWGLPTGSATHIGKAELIDLFKPITPLWRSAARTDARLVQSGLDQNFGIWVPRAYVDAVENNEAFSHLAKEMVEFSSNPSTIVGAAAQAWWTMLRLARVLGLYLPRGGLIGSNGLGNWSSLILERGGFQRALMPTATSAMAAAVPRIKWGGEVVVIPRIGPLDGFVLQETLARASQKEGSLLAAAMDNGFYEVLSASDDAILTPPGQPPISKRQLWKEVQEAGLRSNLTTPEMDEIYRLRADSAVADAPPAVGGTPGPIDPAQAVTETPLADMATATVADGPEPGITQPIPADGISGSGVNKSFSGSIRALHGTDLESQLSKIVSPDEVANRFDGEGGGVFGNGFYSAEDYSWMFHEYPDLPRYLNAYNVDVSFKRALVIDPTNYMDVLRKYEGASNVPASVFVDRIIADGYDGIIIRGWDAQSHQKMMEIEEELTKLNLKSTVIQNQIVSFYPESQVSLVGENQYLKDLLAEGREIESERRSLHRKYGPYYTVKDLIIPDAFKKGDLDKEKLYKSVLDRYDELNAKNVDFRKRLSEAVRPDNVSKSGSTDSIGRATSRRAPILADGPDPDLVMPEPASGKKVLSFEMKGASRSEQEMEPYIRMYRAKFSPEEAEAKIAALREAHSFKMEQFVGLSMDETGLMRPQDLLRTPDGRMFTVSDVARSLGVELTSTDEPARIFDMDLTERFNPSFFPDGNLQVPDDEMVRVAFSDPANPNRIIWAKTDFGTFRRSMRELGSVPDAGTAPILQWKGGVDPLHEAGTSTQIHLDPAQEAAHRRAIPSTVPQPPAPNYPWVGGAPPPEQPPIPPRPRAPDPQGPRRYYELAKKTLLRFMRKPSVGYIQRFGRWIEDLEANMRIAYYTNLRVREGVSAVEAETRAHSRFMDFSGGIMNIEAPLLGRSIMIYRFHRLVFRQIGENIALSMAEANAHPWWALFGETPVGRQVRLVRTAKALPDVLDWRDPDEKLDDAEQLWEFQRRALPWWTRAQLMLPWSVDKDWSQAEKDLSGRVATKANLTVSSILAMDELYMLNAGIQAMLALTVAGAEQAGIDTNQQSVAASRISEAMIQEFTDRVDPTFGAVWEAMNDSSGSPKGVLISRDRAVLYRKVMAFTGVDKQLKMGSLDWIEEDVDGQLRVSPNGIVFLDFLVQFFDRDLARYIAAWDTPELRSGETGRALQRSMAAMLGLYSVSGFDPAAQWDYDARDRAASLRDLVKDAERKNEPKDKIER